jgi:hypothetical protein
MRLRGIDTMEAGNTFLPAFMADYNTRFAKLPFSDKDLHRPLAGHDDLDDALAWKEDRSVSVNLTLRYDQVLFILEPNEIARSLARKRVTVIDSAWAHEFGDGGQQVDGENEQVNHRHGR